MTIYYYFMVIYIYYITVEYIDILECAMIRPHYYSNILVLCQDREISARDGDFFLEMTLYIPRLILF